VAINLIDKNFLKAVEEYTGSKLQKNEDIVKLIK